MLEPYSPSAAEIRHHLAELRRRHGPQPWLTVASGAVAEGYRLAGMTGEEFAELMRVQTIERGRLLLHLRRKPLMRLRKGFDGHSGAISDHDGVLVLHLHSEKTGSFGSYEERELCGLGDVPLWTARQTVRARGRPASSLLITGNMYRPAAAVARDLPRCLAPRSVRITAVTDKVDQWGGRGHTVFDIATHWETLALMPEHVSRELGLPVQERLDQMPWLPLRHPERLEPAKRMAEPSSAPGPALRLVVG